jgi:CRP-like cAMP-binding protein
MFLGFPLFTPDRKWPLIRSITRRHNRLREGSIQLVEPRESAFDAAAFLASSGLGRRIAQFKPKQLLLSQGDPADSIFYLQKGRANHRRFEKR